MCIRDRWIYSLDSPLVWPLETVVCIVQWTKGRDLSLVLAFKKPTATESIPSPDRQIVLLIQRFIISTTNTEFLEWRTGYHHLFDVLF